MQLFLISCLSIMQLDNLLLHHPANGGPPQLKLCDFGLSKDEMESAANSSCGTPEYMAPEVCVAFVLLFPSRRLYGGRANIWSRCIVMLGLGPAPFVPALVHLFALYQSASNTWQ